MRSKTTGQLAHDVSLSNTGYRDVALINVPACGLASAMGAKMRAYAAGKWITDSAMPAITYKKRRHVAFDDIYVTLVTAQNIDQTYIPASVVV